MTPLPPLAAVTQGKAMLLQASADAIPLAEGAVDLTLFSPPYCDARLYLEGDKNHRIARGCIAWVDWMLGVISECVRVTKGAVIVIAAGVTRDRNYWPACEGLMWEWYKRGGSMYRPCYWNRVGIPGSGGKDWFRADVEYAMCFKHPGALAWADNTACGHPPKWAPGGEMSHRLTSGARVNQWGHPIDSGGTGGSIDDVTCGKARPSHIEVQPFKKRHTKSNNRGEDVEQVYTPPTLANPGNLVKVIVGGGVLGHKMAHENEAPYPVKLCEFFIKSLCPPRGVVLDVCGGSGTTAHAAIINGRNAISSDLRWSQCELTRRRLADMPDDKPARIKRVKLEPTTPTLFSSMSLFAEGGAH